MTSTTPRRRITRQRSHIGFTDARTFIAPRVLEVEHQVVSNHFPEKAPRPHESGPRAQKDGPMADRRW
jgi:hypothetical protein